MLQPTQSPPPGSSPPFVICCNILKYHYLPPAGHLLSVATFSNINIYLPLAIHYLLQHSQIVVCILHLLFVAMFSNIIIYLPPAIHYLLQLCQWQLVLIMIPPSLSVATFSNSSTYPFVICRNVLKYYYLPPPAIHYLLQLCQWQLVIMIPPLLSVATFSNSSMYPPFAICCNALKYYH